ncbi:hypothetical protein RclHR1_24950001 [Rhizophagus clarus]|uniref:Uncharacterized protein n=1 Tax=Rhizophagus clarus TaxID=94130 RepID=A0A2Z6R316_9GLOM|nr:hypothetical protein RclHR1_24950001 [Rhizophagus clarus]
MVDQYANFLNKANERMHEIHHSGAPARDPSVNLEVYTIDASFDDIKEIYEELSSVVKSEDEYDFMDMEHYLPKDAIKQYDYIKNLQLNVPVTIYRYHQGNYLGTLNYIWKVPTSPDDRDETKLAQTIASIQSLLPKYFTRQMRKNVLHKYSLVKTITPAILRVLYYDLTGDAAVTSNIISKEIEERLKMMLMLEDPSIIVDTRINNGFKGTKFDYFWNELDAYFNEINAAVDDRHHHGLLYKPLAISIQDLHDYINQRLEEKHGSPFLLQISIPYYICFICADDKHKVPIGGVATSTEVHNKKSMVLQDADLVACDHDFTKLSLTPSVIFFCEVPKSIEESFYSGKVFVFFKDTTFQPSSGIRHATEFFKVISSHYQSSIPPILCLYTDGGPDHRVTYGSVQISLLCLFLKGDFDMLIALRTAPHQSWNNPAKRIMSILNLALQGVALVCETILEDMEVLFNKANTLEEIHRAAKKFSQLAVNCKIKKCNDVTCTICKAIQLPQHIFATLDFLPDPTPSTENNDHYANFHTVYHNTTTEDYHPTLMQATKSSEWAPNGIFVNTKVRDYIECFQCDKLRCVFSNQFLDANEKKELCYIKEEMNYSCGFSLVEEDHEFYNKVFVRETLLVKYQLN